MAAISLQAVNKRFADNEVISDVNLNITDGEFTVFVGPSGCGKSTLLRLIAGLEQLSSGSISFDEQEVSHLPPAKRGVAMVFQSYALYPHMTVYDNMAFGLKLAKTGKNAIRERVHSAARTLQIDKLLARKPRQLSGGQRQRVAIGRAIVREPRVFLFDEPLSNLDAALRVQMRLELKRLHRQLNTTMIYVTHDQVEAMTLADRIVVLNAGRVEQTGSPLELYQQPRNLFVAGFIGSPAMNFLPATITAVKGTTLSVDPGGGKPLQAQVSDTCGVDVGSRITLGLRPQDLQESDASDDGIRGEVLAVEHLGAEAYVHLSCDQHNTLVFRASPDTSIRPGELRTVTIAAQACYVFDGNGKALPRQPA